jgi:hypothetical protein
MVKKTIGGTMRFARRAALVAALLVGCASDKPAEETGRLRAVVDALTVASVVTRVNVAVTPAGVTQDLAYDGSAASFSGILLVPVGLQTITARAYAGTTQVGEGSATVTVTSGTTVSATIRILDTTGPDPVPDHGPIVRSVTATPSSVTVGQAVMLSAVAIDPDGDPMTYAWAQSCSSGMTATFTTPASDTTSWSADAQGSCTIQFTATSKGLTDVANLTVLVFPASGSESGTVDVTGTYVPYPRISSARLSSLSGAWTIHRTDANATFPVTVAPGEYIGVQINWAAGSSAVVPSLSDDCGGAAAWSWAGASFAEGSWQAPLSHAVCMLSFTLSNGLTDIFPIAVLVDGDVPPQDNRVITVTGNATIFPPAAAILAGTSGGSYDPGDVSNLEISLVSALAELTPNNTTFLASPVALTDSAGLTASFAVPEVDADDVGIAILAHLAPAAGAVSPIQSHRVTTGILAVRDIPAGALDPTLDTSVNGAPAYIVPAVFESALAAAIGVPEDALVAGGCVLAFVTDGSSVIAGATIAIRNAAGTDVTSSYTIRYPTFAGWPGTATGASGIAVITGPETTAPLTLLASMYTAPYSGVGTIKPGTTFVAPLTPQ